MAMTTETTASPQATNDPARPGAETGRPGKISVASPLSGMLWFTGWLFTIGFANLVWWKGLLGLVVWPYFLGVAVH